MESSNQQSAVCMADLERAAAISELAYQVRCEARHTLNFYVARFWYTGMIRVLAAEAYYQTIKQQAISRGLIPKDPEDSRLTPEKLIEALINKIEMYADLLAQDIDRARTLSYRDPETLRRKVESYPNLLTQGGAIWPSAYYCVDDDKMPDSNSKYDNESDSEYDSESDSESDSEYDSEYDSKYDSSSEYDSKYDSNSE